MTTPSQAGAAGLVERLRARAAVLSGQLLLGDPLSSEAALALEAKDARIAELEDALRPFASGGPLADVLFSGMDDSETMTTRTSLGHFRRARAALNQNAEQDKEESRG